MNNAEIIAILSLILSSPVAIGVFKLIANHRRSSVIIMRNQLRSLYKDAKSQHDKGRPIPDELFECWMETYKCYKKNGGNGVMKEKNKNLIAWWNKQIQS
jgi:Uncharacterized phage-associated protein